jgi:LysM repeat protein
MDAPPGPGSWARRVEGRDAQAVTRELKLALIVGFSLLLVVTVLVSDHLSRARRSTLDTAVNDTPALVPRIEERSPSEQPTVAVAGTPAGKEVESGASETMPPVPVSGPESQPPVELTLTRRAPEGGLSALERAVRELGGEIRDGRVYLPPSAGMNVQNPVSGTSLMQTINPSQTVPPPTNGGGGANGLAPQPVVPPPAPPAQPERVYEIQPGESLYKIAKRELGDGELWRSLVEFNKGVIPASGAVKAGMKIKLPPKTERRVASAPAPAETPAKPDTKSSTTGKHRTYVVRKGDTLGSIASRELGTVKRMQEILDLNKDVITNPDMVREGMTLKLPGA